MLRPIAAHHTRSTQIVCPGGGLRAGQHRHMTAPFMNTRRMPVCSVERAEHGILEVRGRDAGMAFSGQTLETRVLVQAVLKRVLGAAGGGAVLGKALLQDADAEDEVAAVADVLFLLLGRHVGLVLVVPLLLLAQVAFFAVHVVGDALLTRRVAVVQVGHAVLGDALDVALVARRPHVVGLLARERRPREERLELHVIHAHERVRPRAVRPQPHGGVRAHIGQRAVARLRHARQQRRRLLVHDKVRRQVVPLHGRPPHGRRARVLLLRQTTGLGVGVARCVVERDLKPQAVAVGRQALQQLGSLGRRRGDLLSRPRLLGQERLEDLVERKLLRLNLAGVGMVRHHALVGLDGWIRLFLGELRLFKLTALCGDVLVVLVIRDHNGVVKVDDLCNVLVRRHGGIPAVALGDGFDRVLLRCTASARGSRGGAWRCNARPTPHSVAASAFKVHDAVAEPVLAATERLEELVLRAFTAAQPVGPQLVVEVHGAEAPLGRPAERDVVVRVVPQQTPPSARIQLVHALGVALVARLPSHQTVAAVAELVHHQCRQPQFVVLVERCRAHQPIRAMVLGVLGRPRRLVRVRPLPVRLARFKFKGIQHELGHPRARQIDRARDGASTTIWKLPRRDQRMASGVRQHVLPAGAVAEIILHVGHALRAVLHVYPVVLAVPHAFDAQVLRTLS
eukprot:m.1474014 g.1474014  ORF g.1474014 m.1474014 type:complete len:680 (-) comp25152_c1_seq33:1256-3295(-)